jgi:hypothetical protein
LEQMDRHWFFSFDTKPSAESLFMHMLVLNFRWET